MAGTAQHRQPDDPGALLATTHEVGGGLHVRLRLTRPSDAEPVRAFLESLSPETRRRRFLAATPVVTPALVRSFAFYDPRERLVVAATAPIDGREAVLGIADVAFSGATPAELGVVVAEEQQGSGIGTLLVQAAAALGAQRGAKWVRADMLCDNARMLRLMERLGQTVRTYDEGTMSAYTKVPLRGRRAA
ncbi:MAG: N-acetyltransferase family protein [Nocardioidaceae bacterium]